MVAPSPLPTQPQPVDGEAEAWHLRLLGAVEARRGSELVTRWPSRATALLLARLALAPQRAHPREELVELLWPGADRDAGRNRLRQALSTLKSLLESTGGVKPVAVISADRLAIRLVPGTVTCDVVAFEQLLRRGQWAAAVDGYHGELMPGFYDEWVLEARAQHAAAFERAQAERALPAPIEPASFLPNPWSRLYGVEHAATRLLGLVRHERLVTVLGPGGCGKSRLAIEAARALRDAPSWTPDGEPAATRFVRIGFVPLVDCLDERQALDALARALNIVARDPLQSIIDALGGQPTLLVLDNFEQLPDSALALVSRLLEGLPALHLLVTSRRRLGLGGEQVFVLGGLPVPDLQAPQADILRSPAVALFVDRARAARPDYQPAPTDGPALCVLVRLLDGMPLALELAASRVRGCTLQELLRQLQDGDGTPLLDTLDQQSGRAGADGRHASLRAVMHWSWRQLRPGPAALLQAMTVLGAPARFEAVAAAGGLDGTATRDLLQELIDASWVHSREDGLGLMRHGLLQPVREFAAARLPAGQAALARARVRHWLIEQAPALLSPGPVAFEAELDLVYAAIVGAVADGAPEDGARLAVAFKRHWSLDTLEPMPITVMQALERAAEAPLRAALRSELLELLAQVRGLAGFVTEALVLAEQALACACDDRQRSLGMTRLVALHVLGGLHSPADDDRIAQAVTLGRACGDAVAEATALRMQMLIAVNLRRDFLGPEQQVAHAQRLWEGLGDFRNARRRLLDRASCWAWAGRNEEAADALARCEQEAMRDGDPNTAAMAAWQQGRVLIRLRRWPEAAEAFRRCLRLAWRRNNLLMQSYALMHLPNALVMMGQAEKAARLQAYAIPRWTKHFGTINPIEAGELRRTRRLLRHVLGAPASEELRLSGQALLSAEAVALALASE